MKQSLETICVHGGEHRFPDHRESLSMPIYQTAAFAHPDLGHSPDRFYYTRLTNPTRTHLEETVAALEGAEKTIAFSSGMAAITAVFELFAPGDRIVCASDLYGGTVLLFDSIGKKNGLDLAAVGAKIPVKKLGLTALLAVVVCTVAYGCVFLADYFFYADFRIWTLAIKAFEAPILQFLPYGLLFLTFYVASSVATNCFNYNTIGGKFNGIIVGVLTAAPALILPWIQYITYYSSGAMKWAGSAMHILWLFPIVLILFGTTLINRVIYKATKNPYLGGLINAIIVTLLTITNTCSTM